jgi:hypothetical protein
VVKSRFFVSPGGNAGQLQQQAMPETVTTSGSTPASKGLLARFIGVIASPRDTFEDVARAPRWFGMLALTIGVIAILVGGFLLTKVGQDAWLESTISSSASFGRQMSEQQIQGMERIAPYVGYFAGIQIAVFVIIFDLVIAGISFAVFNAALGGNASFKQVFSVVVHAGAIGLLGQLFAVPLNYMRGTMTSAANLGVLLPMLSDQSFIGHFASAIDLFIVWQVLVFAIGLGVLYKRRTAPIAYTLFGIYAVIALAIALIKMRMGG